MATDFTQDALLHFLQSRGGTVKNSDLVLHFRGFIRDHADRDQNRELFKKFVNSVATVRQTDGVSYVVLRKKFRGYVPGSGTEEGSSSPSWAPVGKNTENAALNPALSRDQPGQKLQQKEAITPAPPGETATKTILPAAGIILNNNNNVEANSSLKQQQVNSTPEAFVKPVTAQVVSHIPQKPELKTPSLSKPPAPAQGSKGGQQRVGFGPLPGVTPASPHTETSPGTLRGRVQPEQGLHPQRAPRNAKHRQSYKTAVNYDEDEEEEEEIPVRQGSAGGAWPLNAPLSDTVRITSASPCIVDTPAPSYIQGTEGETLIPLGPAGISLYNNNNNNVEGNFSLKHQQVNSTPEHFVKPVTAQVVSQIPQKPELKTPSPSKPPASDQASKGGQHRGGFGPLPGITPAPPDRETSPGPEALRKRVQPKEGLHQEPPLGPQLIQRCVKHRQSYKTAVSYDEDEEEEVQIRRGSAGGAWPLNAPLSDTVRTVSSSSPCIVDTPAASTVPQIYVQGTEGEVLAPWGPGLGAGVGQRGQIAGVPLDAAHRNIHQDHQYTQPARVQPEPRRGSGQSQRPWLSSSHSSIYSPSSDAGFSSSEWPMSDSTRVSGWTSGSEDLQIRADERVGVPSVFHRVRETTPKSVTSRADSKTTVPWHRSTGQLYDEQEPLARLSPLHRSTDQLHEDQGSAAPVMPWHLYAGDLYDRDEAESSDGSMSSPYVPLRSGEATRFSIKQRSRMCRSLGDDLDQILQEEARGERERGGGSEEARQSRLRRISSSLSLRYNLSSSSLSSCSTASRYPSLASLDEVVVRKGDKTSPSKEASPSSAHREGRNRHSLVPLEPKEHTWLVKGAAGVWPDIYSLFRDDPSLLNRKDFISGFTVLHWIAKHGDHRVLNTLGYGIEKLGLTFDVNARATSGHTPLHIAAMHGNKNIIRLLVKKFHANVKQRDVAGKRPWQYLGHDAPLEMFHLLGAPMRAVVAEGGVERANTSWAQQQKQQRESRRLRHHASSASGERPLTVAGTAKVKRSTSLAAFLKHKTLHRFHANQSDSSV